MFNVLSLYLKTKDLSWEKCIGICTDGAPSVVGSIRGLASHVEKKILTLLQHTALFTERCWFQKLLGMKRKKLLIMLQKWLALSNKDLFTSECLKSV
jgi:hypothetical protein